MQHTTYNYRLYRQIFFAPASRRPASTLTGAVGFDRITIMTDKIKTTNEYSGQSEMLTPEEYKLYHRIKNLELAELHDEMQQALSKFSKMNPKAYMTLLD